MGQLPKPDVILDIVEEHFEELDFLWEQRESVIFAPDWLLEELAEHEDRCEAHLDGLRLSGAHAVDIARPALGGDERGAAAAATMVLLAFGIPELDAEVLDALERAEQPAREGIRIGLRHCDVTRVATRLTRMASQGDPSVRVAAIDVLAFHRLSPPANVSSLLSELDSGGLIHAALGRFGGPWDSNDLQRALEDGAGPVQRAALEASARVGLRATVSICRQAAQPPGNLSQVALSFLGVIGGVDDVETIRRAFEHAELAEAAIVAAGALGRIELVPDLIDAMNDDTLTVAAGAAFRRITGAEDVDADEPLPAPEGLSNDELDFHQPVVPSDPDKARAWWDSRKNDFNDDGVWQAGRQVGGEWPADLFNALPLESRRDVYYRHTWQGSAAVGDLELEAAAAKQVVGQKG